METETMGSVLRESIRVFERKLGLLNEIQSSCCEVTLAQCHAIVEIGRNPKISLNELAAKLGLDKSTISRTLLNLVQNGAAVRETAPEDRRYATIQLTEKGYSIFKQIEQNMEERFRNIADAIPLEKREQVLESLQILNQVLDKNISA